MLFKRLVFVVGGGILITTLGIFLFSSGIKNIQTQVYSEKIDNLAPSMAQELRPDEYTKLRDSLLIVTEKENPGAAIEILKKESEKNPSISRSCHEILHELGHAAYEKYGDFGEAMKYMDDYCISGYTHGVIESYFSEASDLFAAIKSICNEYHSGTHPLWQCSHGIGHGLMYYTENNLPSSLKYCETISDIFSRLACANGAYMENFNADTELHPSKFLKNDDSFYPCNGGFAYKSDCYINAPIHYLKLHEYNYKSALDWCDGAESPFRGSCYYGVGGQAARRNISNKELLSTLCLYGNSEYRFSCVGGILGTYIGYYNSVTKAYELCDSFGEAEKKYCEEFIPAFMPLE